MNLGKKCQLISISWKFNESTYLDILVKKNELGARETLISTGILLFTGVKTL